MQQHVRPSFQVALAVAVGVGLAVAVLPMLLQTVRERPVLLPPEQAGELVVLVRPGPVVYFPGPDGTTVGFDVDLVRRFAAEIKVPVRFVTTDSPAHLIRSIARGEAHIGAGGLYRPLRSAQPALPPVAATVTEAAVPASDPASAVLWSIGYFAVEPLLIYNSDGYKPATWRDLHGETVAYLEGADLEPAIAAVAAAHPQVHFHPLDLPSAAGLFSQVSDGTISYAVVGSLAAAVARNVYLYFDIAFAVGGKREVAWVTPPRFPKLMADLDRFLERMKRDGTIARLSERYVPDTRQFQRIDAAAFHDSIRTLLPQWKTMFREAQEHTDIEWRLLASVAYQESKWDPYATSETGVRGFMQITEDTAKHLGITDRLDPVQSVLGAARYLRTLKSKLPARIQEPDRTWLALAAFNIGLGHLEDARVLAQKQKLNPDHWSDVKRVLPLLALPEYYAEAKNGYARGGMPVAFVDRVRAYYDIMIAHESALQPRLRMLADTESPPPAAK